VQDKVRVQLQKQNKALAYRARGAEHTCSCQPHVISGEAIDIPHFFLGNSFLSDVKLTASMFAG
jgi:purine nucleoside permease